MQAGELDLLNVFIAVSVKRNKGNRRRTSQNLCSSSFSLSPSPFSLKPSPAGQAPGGQGVPQVRAPIYTLRRLEEADAFPGRVNIYLISSFLLFVAFTLKTGPGRGRGAPHPDEDDSRDPGDARYE